MKCEHPLGYSQAGNLKTVKVHGISIPPAILARVDEVIE